MKKNIIRRNLDTTLKDIEQSACRTLTPENDFMCGKL